MENALICWEYIHEVYSAEANSETELRLNRYIKSPDIQVSIVEDLSRTALNACC